MKEHHKLIKQHEVEIKDLQQQKLEILNQNAELKAQEHHHSSDISELRKRLESTREEKKELSLEIENLKLQIMKKNDQISNHERLRSEELDRRDKMLNDRDILISKLKEDLRHRDEELEAYDEENQLRVCIDTLIDFR